MRLTPGKGVGGLLRQLVCLYSAFALDFYITGSHLVAVNQLLTESGDFLRGVTRCGGDFTRYHSTIGENGEYLAFDAFVGYLLLRERVTAFVVASVELGERVLCEHNNLVGNFVVENGSEKFAIGHSGVPFLVLSVFLSFVSILYHTSRDLSSIF